jgi:hypothetical protein
MADVSGTRASTARKPLVDGSRPTVIAAAEVDLNVSPIGTRSRLADDLLGKPVLRRTLERLARVRQIEGIFLMCPAEQRARCAELVKGFNVTVCGHEAGPAPWQTLVQTARKWSLDGWRGGLGGTTYFDEFTDARLLTALLDQFPAELVLCVPAGAAVLDPDLADRMIARMKADSHDSRVTFVQAPPGLAGILLDARLIRELAEAKVPVGCIFSYKPDEPRKDLIFEPCCCPTPAAVRHVGGRLVADTRRSFETLENLLTNHPDPDMETLGHWLIRRETSWVPSLPCEVEIELTTDDPYPNSLVRPRGAHVGRRGPIHVEILRRIVEELAAYDDSLIVLGGFGDPVRHPDLPAILEALRPPKSGNGSDGVFGLAIRSAGVNLTDDERIIPRLIERRVDVLNVALDAWTPQTYARLHGPSDGHDADLNRVLENVQRLEKARQERRSIQPLLLPEFLKSAENVHELDEFHDGWLRRLGSVMIGGCGQYARQWEDRGVMSMAPSTRTPCRRIQQRCLVLADGRVTLCDQDFRGLHAVGRLEVSGRTPRDQGLEPLWPGLPDPHALPVSAVLGPLWRGGRFEQVREAHRTGRFNANPLCAACEEWHRP